MPYLDFTHPFTHDMPVFPGDSLPEWQQAATTAKEGYTVWKLRTGMHVGTHIDAPLHMVEGGRTLDVFPPDHFIGPGVLVDARGHNPVGAELLPAHIPTGAIVLVLTGWDTHFREPHYYLDYPELTLAFADRLVAAGAHIVGLDFPSPDRAPYAVHKRLLGNEVLIMENLTGLDRLLPITSFEVIALPARYACDGAPVRVIARV